MSTSSPKPPSPSPPLPLPPYNHRASSGAEVSSLRLRQTRPQFPLFTCLRIVNFPLCNSQSLYNSYRVFQPNIHLNTIGYLQQQIVKRGSSAALPPTSERKTFNASFLPSTFNQRSIELCKFCPSARFRRSRWTALIGSALTIWCTTTSDLCASKIRTVRESERETVMKTLPIRKEQAQRDRSIPESLISQRKLCRQSATLELRIGTRPCWRSCSQRRDLPIKSDLLLRTTSRWLDLNMMNNQKAPKVPSTLRST
jgi:hypothetical protein